MTLSKQNKSNFNIFWKIISFILLFLIQQSPTILLGSALQSHSSFKKSWELAIIFSGLCVFIVGLMLGLLHKTQSFATRRFTKKSWLIFGIGLIAITLINVLLQPLIKPTGNQNVQSLTHLMLTFPLMFVVYAILVVPITEEVFFRGFFINWFFEQHLAVGCFLSALLFGLMHVSRDPFYFLSKFLLGLVLGWSYLRTHNIKTNILLHFSNNFLAIFIGVLMIKP